MLQLKNVIQNNSLLYVLLLKVLHCFFFYTLNLLTIFTIFNQKTAIFFLWSFFVENTIFIRYYKTVAINDKFNELGGIMKQEKFSKKAAKNVRNILNAFLITDANSTSCIFMYQPKPPNELARFKKSK